MTQENKTLLTPANKKTPADILSRRHNRRTDNGLSLHSDSVKGGLRVRQSVICVTRQAARSDRNLTPFPP